MRPEQIGESPPAVAERPSTEQPAQKSGLASFLGGLRRIRKSTFLEDVNSSDASATADAMPADQHAHLARAHRAAAPASVAVAELVPERSAPAVKKRLAMPFVLKILFALMVTSGVVIAGVSLTSQLGSRTAEESAPPPAHVALGEPLPVTRAASAPEAPAAQEESPRPTPLPEIDALPAPVKESSTAEKKEPKPVSAKPETDAQASGRGQRHPIIAESAEEAQEPVRVKAATAAPIGNALGPRPNGLPMVEAPKREATPAATRPPVPSAGPESKKYGWNGIAIIKSGGVVVTGKDGQRVITVGNKLPDGSVLKGVDAKANAIVTDRGQFLLTE